MKALDIDFGIKLSKQEIKNILYLVNTDVLSNIFNDNDAKLPDDANVIYHQIEANNETDKFNNKANLKKIMKSQNRNDIFIFMKKNQNYAIYGAVKDYGVIYRNSRFDRSMNDNPTRLLDWCDFALQLKEEDITRAISKKKTRVQSKFGSTEYDKERFFERESSLIDENMKRIKSQFMRIMMLLSLEEKDNINVGDIILSNTSYSYRNGPEFSKTLEKKVRSSGYDRDNTEKYTYALLDIFTGDKDYKSDYEIKNKSTDKYYVFTKIKDEVRDIFNDINLKELAKKRQSFPLELYKNIIKDFNTSETNAQKIEELTSGSLRIIGNEYDNLIGRTKVDIERKSKKDYEEASSYFKDKVKSKSFHTSSYSSYGLKYRDKSGYVVYLDKYFEKRIQLIKEIPAEITLLYNELYQRFKQSEDMIKSYIQGLVEQEEWNTLRQISAYLDRYSTKSLNQYFNRYNYNDVATYQRETKENIITRIKSRFEDQNTALNDLKSTLNSINL
jgi:hypothetical protein